MPIPLALIQKTVNYIVKQCYHLTETHNQPLTASMKKRLAKEMTGVILSSFNLKVHTGKPLVIGWHNQNFNEYLGELKSMNIMYPGQAVFMLYTSGISYQKVNGVKREIVNLRKEKRELAAMQAKATRDLLRDERDAVENLMDVLTARMATLGVVPSMDASFTDAEYTPFYSSARAPITLADFIKPKDRAAFGLEPHRSRIDRP